jgi:ketosteroid isomerase-like protein
MDRARAVGVLDDLHAAQNRYYGGGDDTALRALLSDDIMWTVPGDNAIAGTYRGLDEVFGYFDRRRRLADGTFRMHRRDVLSGDGDSVAALTDGTATIDGTEWAWSTVGLYRVRSRRIAACWLLPLDQALFDRVWRPAGN